jgi:phenylacetic acid degradation operon negative regulatory protein
MQVPIGPSLSLALAAANASGEIIAAGLKLLWDEFFDSGRFDRKLARLERRGILKRRDDPILGRIIELTELGRRLAAGGRDPAQCLGREWDGRWWIVVFDVPELQRRLRDRLRRSLRELGFGHLQDSVWVSPDPPEYLRQQLNGIYPDARNLSFLEIRLPPGESSARFVRALWDFERINQRYRDYLQILRNRPRWYETAARVRWLRAEWRAWNRAVSLDPLLPAPLLPPGYLGGVAWAERCAVLRSLSVNLGR